MNDYKEKLQETIKKHNDTVYLTIGFRWKNPTVMDKPMTSEEAIEWVRTTAEHYAKVEIDVYQGKAYLNAYTTGDMW